MIIQIVQMVHDLKCT